jgi:outer membrane biosynthesis protein TonB
LLVLGGLLSGGCTQPAAAPPPPPPGAPPPELQIGDDTQGEADPPPPPSTPAPTQVPTPPSAPPPPPAEAGQMAPQAQPTAPPTAPPASPAPVAQPVQPAPAEPAPTAGGQWTYTSQYGWLWLPYQRDYTYVSADGGAAYEYAYYPGGGWRWYYAPWVLGWGPSPYWGRLGPRHYVWYSRPWFRVGVVHRGPVYHRRWHRR